MTIARDFTSRQGAQGGEPDGTSVWDVAGATSFDEGGSAVPAQVRRERLDAQVRSFERAGYRLETRAGMQAIVFKPRERRRVRDAAVAIGTLGLALLPSALGVRRVYHRVVITVDDAGAVRLA